MWPDFRKWCVRLIEINEEGRLHPPAFQTTTHYESLPSEALPGRSWLLRAERLAACQITFLVHLTLYVLVLVAGGHVDGIDGGVPLVVLVRSADLIPFHINDNTVLGFNIVCTTTTTCISITTKATILSDPSAVLGTVEEWDAVYFERVRGNIELLFLHILLCNLCKLCLFLTPDWL